MPPAVAVTLPAPPDRVSAVDQQILLMETLKSLLDGAIRSLSGGEAQPLLEISRQISSTAQDLTGFSLQLGRLPLTGEAQQRRRRLLTELGEQRAFCRAMLRRWRRSIALRQQLIALRDEPAPYTSRLELK